MLRREIDGMKVGETISRHQFKPVSLCFMVLEILFTTEYIVSESISGNYPSHVWKPTSL